MKPYWPVSNLRFLPKVLDLAVANSWNKYNYQSAYRKFHSTESALLQIHADILLSVVVDEVIAWSLLDLLLPLIPLTILTCFGDSMIWFGVTGKVLDLGTLEL